MAKGKVSALVTYEMYGPQKGYDDPEMSLQTLAKGINDVMTASEFKRMKLSGDASDGVMTIVDRETGSQFSVSIKYVSGERLARAMVARVEGDDVAISVHEYKFWHYRGGDVARELLRDLRGPIMKEEPVPGDDDFTTYQAAKFLGVEESKMHSLRRDPYGPPWHKVGSRVYFPREQLSRWRDENISV